MSEFLDVQFNVDDEKALMSEFQEVQLVNQSVVLMRYN